MLYDRALTVRPDLAEAFFNRGNTLWELMRYAEALASYDRALIVRPNYADALCNRGLALQELKRDEALQAQVPIPDRVRSFGGDNTSH